MTLRDDSYGSVEEVRALTRHLLDGNLDFDDTTVPTLDDVERFIDRASAVLNVALAGQGFAVPVTVDAPVLACADWVVMHAAKMVELTQQGDGLTSPAVGPNNRAAYIASLSSKAKEFAADNARAFRQMGVTVTTSSSEGLVYTGLDAHAYRADPGNARREQPKFRRGMFEA